MDFHFTPQEEAFRQEVRSFLAEHLPPADDREPETLARWNRALAEKRWIGFSWPREEGGGGGTLIQQFILKEEMSKADAPPLGSDFMGLQWVGPALIRHGKEDQKRRFLPDILASRTLWCTGYSEPAVGSDLASLQTRAERDGEEYVLNGSKIWTSAAHHAKWIFLLCRTSPEKESRYHGITCLLVSMQSPGIEVQPILTLTGNHTFNQTFFNDVRVPVNNRLGQEGEGWKVVMGALANERSGISESTEMERELEALKQLARRSRSGGRPALEDPSVRSEIARFETWISAMRLNGMRYLTNQLRGGHPSSETSVNKLMRGRIEIPMMELATRLLGNGAQEGGSWQERALTFHGTVIGGGTPNIQRNIIAQRILGLPKD
ncbi:MAG: hypothetical protein CL910_06250 [Deltaproteobacteria bacterium]|jgi:alkylation response protein AidB-like acyl-CoA dehydrogenase|nr:hypothetical protein [Deltaproteobacteria bacterium]